MAKTGRARTAKPKSPETVAKQESALARAMRDNFGVGPVSSAKVAEAIHAEIWRCIHEANQMREARDKGGEAAPARTEEGEPQDKGEPAA